MVMDRSATGVTVRWVSNAEVDAEVQVQPFSDTTWTPTPAARVSDREYQALLQDLRPNTAYRFRIVAFASGASDRPTVSELERFITRPDRLGVRPMRRLPAAETRARHCWTFERR